PRARAEEARDAALQLGREADALAKARDLAQGSVAAATQMQDAVRSLESNKLGDAQAAQQAALQNLKRVQDALAEVAERDVERLAKRLRATEKAIDDLAEAQERLQKRSADARNAGVSPAARAAMEQIAREQEELREQADELAQRLTGQRQEQAAQDLRRAARSMSQAREKVDQDQPPQDKQSDAIDRLDDAQQE